MKRAVVVTALLLFARLAAAQTVSLSKAAVGTGYTGNIVTFRLSFIFAQLGLVLHDPTPAGVKLLRVQSGTATLDCTTTPTGTLPGWSQVRCDNAGEMQATPVGSQGELLLTYSAPTMAGSLVNNAYATCSGSACTPAPSTSATAFIEAPNVTIVKTGDAQVGAGKIVHWTVIVTNVGEGTLQSFVVDDPLPSNVTFNDVVIGTSTFTNLSTTQTASDGTQASLVNGAVHLAVPKPLAPGGRYTFDIHATVANDPELRTVTNRAILRPQGGGPITSAPWVTTVTTTPPELSLGKTVFPTTAAIGDTVTYTLNLTETAPQPGPIVLTDRLDPALRLTSVRFNGQTVACGASPVPIGPMWIDCGADHRVLTAQVHAGDTLPQSVTLQLDTLILPSASQQLANIAVLTDKSGNSQSVPVNLTVSNASAGHASLIVTAAKLVAQKDDLVPFVANVGVPNGQSTLPDPVLQVTPTHGLRVVDVHVTHADGTTAAVKPDEVNGSLRIPLGTIPTGAIASINVRTRINGRAAVGGREILNAVLKQGDADAASAQASVRIQADGEFDLGTILGDVYRDDNGNGQRDRGEPGIAGALVVMDDGLQAVTDAEGRYHLAAIIPGDRAIKVAGYRLPAGSQLTTDGTRIVPVTPGSLTKIDFGVHVPPPEPPARKPTLAHLSPELRPAPGGHIGYRLSGATIPGSRIRVDGIAARVDKIGIWGLDVELQKGRNRFVVVYELPDGRVVVSTRDVFWVERADGGGLIVPRDEDVRLTLRFPGGALAEPTFLLEGTATTQMKSLSVAGHALTPDAQGHVALKLRLPESGAGIAIDAQFGDGVAVRFDHELQTQGDFVFLVGLAEGKVGYVQKSDAAGSSAGFYAQGRVKLYAKGRIQGRWLLEGGLDIDTSQLDNWRDLFRGDPTRIFRNLDPDRFYTVYGDASQTTAAAQSNARLFVRIQFDRSELLFGNLQTGMTGVEMGRYARSATGGRLEFIRASTEPNARPTTQVILLGAWLVTQRAHDELRGTGGSLYYLSHRTVVEGSEQVRIELRDQISDRPLANTAQHATVDYEVDYLAGRLILREPLASVAPAPTLVRSSNVDGDRAYLVVDYEYVVDGDSDDGTLGARANQKLGPVRLGGTVVNEFRAGGNYTLLGGDVQIDLKKYGVIIGEYAHSYGALTSFSRSDDGGLTYADALGSTPGVPTQRQGSAYKAEADLHFGPVSFHPYFRGIDQGYTDTAHAQDAGDMQWGAEASARFAGFAVRLHYDERRYQQALLYDATGAPVPTSLVHDTRRDIGGEIGRTFGGRVQLRLGARSEHADDPQPARAGHRTAIGLRVEVRIVPRLSLYAQGQYAVEKGGGDPSVSEVARDNSLGAIGAIVQLPWQTKATGEVSYGAQGAGGLVSVRSELGPGRALYGTFTLSQDRDDRVSASVAAGGRERIADAHGNARAVLFAEDQFREGPLVGGTLADGGRSHMQTAGLDLPLSKRVVLGAAFEHGQVLPSGTPFSPPPALLTVQNPPSPGAAPLDRTAGSVYASYAGDALRAQLKAELRSDSLTQSGAHVAELQWLVQAMVTWRIHKDFTLRGKLFLSQSTNANPSPMARSNEADVGFAWRPSWTDRLVLLGRYTWLDEGLPPTQAANGPTDPLTSNPLGFRERAHVASLAGDGRVVWRLSLGEKIAVKVRQDSQPDGLQSATMLLWINRLTMHVTRTWDALAEYRLLYGPGPSLSHGVAIEVNRIIVGHLRLGVGWNFSDVGDDETTLGRGSEKGFFVRAQGFY